MQILLNIQDKFHSIPEEFLFSVDYFFKSRRKISERNCLLVICYTVIENCWIIRISIMNHFCFRIIKKKIKYFPRRKVRRAMCGNGCRWRLKIQKESSSGNDKNYVTDRMQNYKSQINECHCTRLFGKCKQCETRRRDWKEATKPRKKNLKRINDSARKELM